MLGAAGRLLPTVVLLSTAAVLGVFFAGAATGATSAPAAFATPQRLLIVDHRVAARTDPRPNARVVGAVAAHTPLTASQTVLPVVRSKLGPGGGRWLQVRLPLRPNGSTGWIPASSGETSATSWRIVIHRAAREAVVFDGTRARARFPVIVGKRGTPTPLGTFFVVEKVHLAPGVAEGPWALLTSAHSYVLHEFAGGNGQVALHGIVGMTDPLGTFSSHGCVRFGVRAITWIAAHVDAGAPVIVNP